MTKPETEKLLNLAERVSKLLTAWGDMEVADERDAIATELRQLAALRAQDGGEVRADGATQCATCGGWNKPGCLPCCDATPDAAPDAVELRARIEKAWHNHDEAGRVMISMADAQALVETHLAHARSAGGEWDDS